MVKKIDAALTGLLVYVVGGAVRDALLGLPAGDRDWVVVGSTPQAMVQHGFMPVGDDFPVFLHPVTKEEYALARTERKTGRGYKGFTFYTGPEVRLEEDLQRRDLTINAIASTSEGVLIDPTGGIQDLKARLFRHVGRAFAEDPLRILRLARFAARFTDFSIAHDTLALCQQMVQNGETDALVAERVWKELARGLMENAPSRLVGVLEQTGALARILPELQLSPRLKATLDRAAQAGLPLAGRYALLCSLSTERERLSQRLRAPNDCRDYARLLPVLLTNLPTARSSQAQLSLIERCDALRKPDRFLTLLQVAALTQTVDQTAWQNRIQAVRTIDAQTIAQRCNGEPARIKTALRSARLHVLELGHVSL